MACIETVLIHGEHDALGVRYRDDDHAAVVWHQSGTTADVIAALLDLPLPEPSTLRRWPEPHPPIPLCDG